MTSSTPTSPPSWPSAAGRSGRSASAVTRWWHRVSAETLGGRMIAVVDESDTVLGAGRIRPYEQAWGGRHLRMGGVAGVYVEPSARGRGVATTLTRALIARMGELGDVVSCLFPTTATLYRRSGYEIGGVQTRMTYAAHLLRDLGSLARGAGWRRAACAPRCRTTRSRCTTLPASTSARHGVSGPMVRSVAALTRDARARRAHRLRRRRRLRRLRPVRAGRHGRGPRRDDARGGRDACGASSDRARPPRRRCTPSSTRATR